MGPMDSNLNMDTLTYYIIHIVHLSRTESHFRTINILYYPSWFLNYV